MIDRLRKPLSQPEQDRGDVLARGGQKGVVAAGFLERLPKEVLGRAEVVVVGADPREVDQRSRTIGPGLELCHHAVEQHPGAPAVAALKHAEAGLHRAAENIVARFGRSQPHGEFVELGGGRWGTAGFRPLRSLFERARDGLVWTRGRQGEVPGPFLWVGDARARAGVQLATERWVGGGVRTRC